MNGNGKAQGPPQLTIQMLSNGSVNVTGPILNRGLCYAMLELARDAIRDYTPEDLPRITPATIIPRDLLGG